MSIPDILILILTMPKVTFIDRNGAAIEIDAPVGASLLRIAHDHDIDLEGACGGSLACATCHVIVDPAWANKLPEPTEAEEDMLDLAFNVTATSRLGCQCKLTDDLNGIIVKLPKI